MEVAIPVLLSMVLGPGVGQLYNKDYKKGAYLIGLSLIVVIGACVWFARALAPYLPPDIATLDKAILQPFVENAVKQVMATRGATWSAYMWILMALWVYSVGDAYRVAMLRRSQKPPVKS